MNFEDLRKVREKGSIQKETNSLEVQANKCLKSAKKAPKITSYFLQ